ncbi:MAG: hypothetical protein WBZ29_06575 [Methanocella sp.]
MQIKLLYVYYRSYIEMLGVALNKVDLKVPPEKVEEIRRAFDKLKVAVRV